MTDPALRLNETLLAESVEELYEHAPCGYFSTLPDGMFARVNQTFLTWLGYSREEIVGRKRFQDLLTLAGRIFHETHYAPLLRMQGTVNEVAFELVGWPPRRIEKSATLLICRVRLRSSRKYA